MNLGSHLQSLQSFFQRSPELLPELALLCTSAFCRPAAGPPLVTGGPSEVPGALSQETPAWHPAPSDTLPQPPSPQAGPS